MRDRKRGAEVNLVKTLAKQEETHTDFMQLSLSLSLSLSLVRTVPSRQR